MTSKKESNFCKSLTIIITMISSIILVNSSVNILPSDRQIKKINKLILDNNTLSYNINFDDCNYFTTQYWTNLHDLDNFLNTNYNFDNKYYTKKYGNKDNYYCNFSDKVTYIISILGIILGLLTFCFANFMVFKIDHYENKNNILLI